MYFRLAVSASGCRSSTESSRFDEMALSICAACSAAFTKLFSVHAFSINALPILMLNSSLPDFSPGALLSAFGGGFISLSSLIITKIVHINQLISNRV
jgi:hypothetical protein